MNSLHRLLVTRKFSFNMDRWENKVAVVTGASSGIGAAIVIDLVKAGLTVAALARRYERLQELQKQLPAELQSKFHPVKCDVSNKDSVTEAFDWVEKNLGGIDVLVNNAGVAKFGHLVDLDTELIESVIKTNILGIVYTTQRAFASMKQRKFNGHVININSVAGHKVLTLPTGAPESNIYSPTKFAVTAMTEIYRREFSGLDTQVKITSISPGLVDTEIIPEDKKAFFAKTILKPEDISQAVLYTLSTPPHVQIHELTIKPVGEMF